MSDTVAARMAADRATLAHHGHGGLDDLHVEMDKSAAHEAARENDLDELRRLAAVDGADSVAHGLDKYGLTPLHWAADRGHAEAAAYLLAIGAAVNAVEKRLFKRTPLHFAAIAPSRDTVAVLLARGADAGAVEYRGWTACQYAAYAGDIEILRALRDARGCEPTRPTKAGETALHLAARNGHGACITLLLAWTRDVDELLAARDGSGLTALDAATDAGHTEAAAALLLARQRHTRAKAAGYAPLGMAAAPVRDASVDDATSGSSAPAS